MLAGTQKPMLGMKLNSVHPLADGLRGCWLFNEGVGNVAYDSSGYGNHGTLTNMAFPSTATSGWNPGRSGSALAFDGLSGYVNGGNASSLDITDAITIVALIKTTVATGVHQICSKDTSVAGGRAWQFRKNGNNIEMIVFADGTVTSTGTSNIVDGAYHQVVGTYDGFSAQKVYVDAIEECAITQGGDILSAIGDVTIGKMDFALSPGLFDGVIDEVEIYNHALSAEEIKWLYHEPYAMFERGELLL